jgi:Ca2+-binding RTX toxin-like protein
VGGAGNDTLNGGEGADTLNGGAGDDRYTLEDALDTVVEEAGGGNDLVQAAFSFTLAANIERGGLLGTGNFSITGSADANRLDGNAGANVLDGGGGADTLLGLDGADQLRGGEGTDTLEGGLGADTLTGGAGNDRFVYRAIEEVAGDVVADFVRGDRIDFSRLDAIASTAAVNDTFVFRGTGAITGAGQVNFAQNAAANTTTLFGHVDGDGVADFSLTVLGLVSFVSSDIAL